MGTGLHELVGRQIWLGCVLIILCPIRTQAQSLVQLLRQERSHVVAEQFAAAFGYRAVPLPPEKLPSTADAIFERRFGPRPDAVKAPESTRSPIEIVSWRRVRKLERNWFTKRFGGTEWAFLGSNGLTPLDTMMTRELRARMEAFYGAPTRTLAEVGYQRQRRPSEMIEFEYWFILNDSIPIKIIDVNGPFERGIVVASDHQYRSILISLRETFLGHLAEHAERKSYVDYYYNEEADAWYRTGYNGETFFLRPIRPPELFRGRPRLEKRDE